MPNISMLKPTCPEPTRALAHILVAAIASLAVAATAQTATPGTQSWRDATQAPEARAKQLLAAMTLEQKIALVNAVDPAEYAPLASLGLPALTRVDASAGLRGDRGVTAFPVPLAQAATFDPGLVRAVGAAIADEARGKGWNVILGPTVDVAREGLTGRLTEAFGEEPLVAAQLGAAVASGMQGRNVIAQAKHYTAYHGERERLTMNVAVSPRTLHEIYNVPFEALVRDANIASLMGSYPKVNGTFALENAALINLIKSVGFKGYFGTDFMGGADGVAQFNAGVDSWALQPFLRKADALRDGRIKTARLDDAVQRTLWAIFSTGLYDRPVPTVPAAVVTTPTHQALARQVAEDSIVLLKNEGLLPLQRRGRVAVIGPAGRDTVTGVMWSTYVEPGSFTTPIDAIADVAGPSVRVTHAQGSIGDFVLPTLAGGPPSFGPPLPLVAPDGSGGWRQELFASPDRSGPPLQTSVVRGIDLSGSPVDALPAQWSARWSARYTPAADGVVRLTASLSGTLKVSVGGKTVIDGMRSTAVSFPGGGPYTYPLHGLVDLKAGKPVDIVVDYATTGRFTAPRMQLGWQPQSMIPAAVEAAKQADIAVVFVNQVTGEEMDRDDYALPADQNALIDAVAAANPNTVVVLNTGGAVKMPWLRRVKSVVQMWYPGSAAGTAIARVLFGDAEPGGRLPITFPADETQGPRPYRGGGTANFSEGPFVGYRWFAKERQQPLFPFGYGMSYTSFAIERVDVRPLATGDERTTVSVRVANTGAREGSTVVQVYGGPLPAAVETPVKLLGFAKVRLPAGAAQTVTIALDRRTLSYWDEQRQGWVTPAGSVPVRIAFSSADAGRQATLPVR